MAGALAVLTANSLEANGAYWVSGDRLSDLMDLMYNNKHVSPVEYRAAPSTHQHREDRPGPPERHLDSKGAKGAVRLCPRRKKSRTLSPREIIIDANYLSTFFHLPQPEAAVKMVVSLSALKSVCRRVGVPRWPYKRQYTTNDSPSPSLSISSTIKM
ncbi:hypothetical protein GUITHDRAFT_155139 [Guillardia theta CCMP2712]|uniref:RWP-RK domain-containing protein n=1 Tax=Guillardia theta (strain CCMP2712) TaxID=905079 RepID=L1ILR4_GUITC|nr:hypothetical protein GUITHDRAFT_155139 [Guillardia theta CCMP2712]EKX36740.1 hypothetical protein GUITHDRAFT_155139 [Guillardia theta CCMP2712]|eukprot:XP_005823720.1 hypothetical protein GUITHDRAFT_155139 [Guillardia theta CCMP2712]